jgi:histidinol-phosphate aminotransferase
MPYVPGRGEDEIMAEYGLSHVIKLASNESPVGPFPEVIAAIAAAAGGVNRYPDTTYQRLRPALAAHLGIPADHLWFGGGGADLLLATTLATSGPGSSVVYPHPSFVAYRLTVTIAGADAIEVRLDADHRLDLAAMQAAVRPDTRLVYVCNPNNPTGTHVPTDQVLALLDSVPESVLVVVDEAYHHYVAATDYRTMVPLVQERPNLAVLHTFSKIYGLAGLRLGYMVARPAILTELRKTQLPFTATDLAQVAAATALRHTDRLEERIAANAAGRHRLVSGLAERGLEYADSQTNFVFARLVGDPKIIVDQLLRRGVIVRPTGIEAVLAETGARVGWVRVTVGTLDEVDAFFRAYDEMVSG